MKPRTRLQVEVWKLHQQLSEPREHESFVISNHDFYSYEAKYIDEHGAALEIPAKLSDEIIKKRNG